MSNILVIDDDPLFLELIQATLSQHSLTCSHAPEIALSKLRQIPPDLIILDIHMGTTNGYQVCKQIREHNPDVPILFISSSDTLESRLQAYGAGGHDFLAKPYQTRELNFKVDLLIFRHQQHCDLKHQLQDNSSLIHHIQQEAASLQAINRFIQSCMHCKDLNTLYAIFFVALKELNTCGVLMIADNAAQSSGNPPTRLEQEILTMSQALPRIHSFGNDRALFSWSQATLLVRELGPLIDVLAILMDSLEVIISAIKAEGDLVEKIAQLEEANEESQKQVESLISDMTLSLQDNLITLGLVSDLSSTEEQAIRDIVSDYADRIRENMAIQHQHSQQIKHLVNQLRAPSDSIERLLAHAHDSDNHSDAVELF